MKVEVAILGSPSLISLMVSVDVKQHGTEHKTVRCAMHVTFLAEWLYLVLSSLRDWEPVERLKQRRVNYGQVYVRFFLDDASSSLAVQRIMAKCIL